MKKTWGLIWMTLSVFVGAVIFSSLRTLQYILNDYHPNIAPGMFIILSPVLALPIALVAIMLNAIFARYLLLDAYWKWVLSGVAYSSILLGLISPWLLLIPLLLNPFSIVSFVKIYRKIANS